MSGSERRHTVPEVARLLGISERGVRDKIERGQLRAVKEGKRWIVLLPPDAPADDAAVRGSGSGSASGSGAVVGEGSPIGEITPAEVERAIARTGQQYTADLRLMLEELRAVYEGQVAAKDETIAAQADTIAELRRRAEAAERERDELRSQAAPQPPSEAPTDDAAVDTPDAPAPAQGFWARVRRVFGGE